MHLKIDIDLSELKARTRREVKNLAYSTAQAINDTARDIQYRIQGDVQKIFHLRKKNGSWAGASSEYSEATGDQPSRSERSFIVRSIKVFAWANVLKNKMFAEVGVNDRPRLLLWKFEKGGQRDPFVGKRIAVPITETARKGNINNPIDSKVTFKRLGFKTRYTKAGKRQIKGKMRSFVLSETRTHSQGGVYQRVGPKRNDIRMLYSFRRAFRLRAVLKFVARAKDTYQKQFKENFYSRYYKLRNKQS